MRATTCGLNLICGGQESLDPPRQNTATTRSHATAYPSLFPPHHLWTPTTSNFGPCHLICGTGSVASGAPFKKQREFGVLRATCCRGHQARCLQVVCSLSLSPTGAAFKRCLHACPRPLTDGDRRGRVGSQHAPGAPDSGR